MHAGRLHAVLSAVVRDEGVFDAPKRLSDLLQCLLLGARVAGGVGELLIGLRTVLLKRACLDGRLGAFTPSQEQILEEIGARGLVGRSLWTRVDAILRVQRNNPSALVEDLAVLLEDASMFHRHAQATISAFEQLGIELTDLQEDESEVGVILPASVVAPTLDEVEKELHEMGFVIRTIADVVDGDYGSVRIRTLSTLFAQPVETR